MQSSNLKKNIYISIWIFLLVVFQTSVCVYWDIGNVFPNIIFVFVICFSVLEESFAYCTAVPLICGIIIDALCGNTILRNTLSFSLSALICYAAGEHFFKEKVAFALPMVFVFTFINELISMLAMREITAYTDIVNGIKHVILPFSAYNTAMTLVIYPLCKFTIYKKIPHELVKKVRKRY